MHKREVTSAAAICLSGILLFSLAACREHALTFTEGREATCTEPGVVAHWHCDDCGLDYLDREEKEPIEDVVIPAKGHSFGEFRPVEPFNCLLGGEEARYCSVCNAEERRSITPAAHQWDFDNVCKVCGVACHETEGLKYTRIVENGRELGYSVDGGASEEHNLIIPRYHNSLPVLELGEGAFEGREDLVEFVCYAGLTSIGDSAFEGCTGFKRIILPESVVSIGADAFRSCSELEEIAIPSATEVLGSRAFYGCSRLKTLSIGAGLAKIGRSAFFNCASLETITVDAANETFSGAGNCLVERATGLLIRGGNNSKIPAGVKEIGEYAFNGCEELRSITIPHTVERIGDFAFRDCTGLRELIYEGTQAEWEALPKGSEWNKYVHETFTVRFSAEAE